MTSNKGQVFKIMEQGGFWEDGGVGSTRNLFLH